jgi:hypothetical protein
MPKFTLIAEHTDLMGQPDGTKVQYEFYVDGLEDVLQHVELFIRGCGYNPTGTLDYVRDEEFYGDGHDGMGSTLKDYPELYESTESPSGSPWASAHYGHDINLRGNK